MFFRWTIARSNSSESRTRRSPLDTHLPPFEEADLADVEDSIRHYGREDVRRLRFIRQAQAAGFTLEEIRELLELDAGEDRCREECQELCVSAPGPVPPDRSQPGIGEKRSSNMMATSLTAVSHPRTVRDVFSCPRMAR
jgi:hypothetical protein